MRIGLVVLLAIGCWTAEAVSDQQADVTADKLEQVASHAFRARGNVKLTVGNVSIQAERVELRTAGEADDEIAELTAQGGVVLTRGQERLSFERLQFNPEAGTGTFDLQRPTK